MNRARHNILKIIPSLENQILTQINLNKLFEEKIPRWQEYRTPFLAEQTLHKYHKENNCVTYGGWMENREFMWKGTYMDADKRYIHLGVDVNVSRGTKIVAPYDCKIIDVYKDHSIDVGWGLRVILQPKIERADYLILGHLAEIFHHRAGESVPKGFLIGSVGTWPGNGNVFEHIHIQKINHDFFQTIKNLEEIDGYARVDEENLEQKYPNPLL